MTRRFGSSYKDPSGHIFIQDNIIYRSISPSYREHWDHLMTSGLYDALQKQTLLIPSQTVNIHYGDSYKVIKPTLIPFISYPYEWCFSQLKDAALATLKIQKIALAHNMILKDANAYNIQFLENKPILIDSLSFEIYKEGEPWIAYRQFCMHFLGTLLLMKYKSAQMNQIMKVFMDGIPLKLVSSLLPAHTWLNPSVLIHIHMHAKAQSIYQEAEKKAHAITMPKTHLLALIENLQHAIEKITLSPVRDTEWANYYQHTNYTPEGFTAKQKIVYDCTKLTHPETIWDLGANTGEFSRVVSALNTKNIVAFDLDELAVEQNYLECKKDRDSKILPLVMDLTNPSASIGWNENERMSLTQRGPADTVLALALVHHLVISNNVPFWQLADFLSRISRWLIIEFIPKDDSMAQKLLQRRRDIFDEYSPKEFEVNFSNYFQIKKTVPIPNTKRSIYLMKNKITI